MGGNELQALKFSALKIPPESFHQFSDSGGNKDGLKVFSPTFKTGKQQLPGCLPQPKTRRLQECLHPPKTKRLQGCLPPPKTRRLQECLLLPHPAYRMLLSVCSQAQDSARCPFLLQTTEEVILVQKVEQHDPPPPEAALLAEAPHPHHTVQVSPCLPVSDVFSLRHRLVQCVLSPKVAEQAVLLLKVDQHAPPPPEDVQQAEDADLPPPRTVKVCCRQLMSNDERYSCHVGDVCDEQFVTDDQEEKVTSVFLLSHTLRRLFHYFFFLSCEAPLPPPTQDQRMS